MFALTLNLYAAGHGPVLRYDIITGSLIDDFTHGHDLAEVHAIAFGADRNLYVANDDSCVMGPSGCTGSKSEIVRFDSLSGDFVDVYATSGQAGLVMPWDLTFGPDGALFVANTSNTSGMRARPAQVPLPAHAARSQHRRRASRARCCN